MAFTNMYLVLLWFDGVKDDVDQMAADNLIVIDTIAVADDKSYNESIIETPSSHAQTYHHTEMDTKKKKQFLKKQTKKQMLMKTKQYFFKVLPQLLMLPMSIRRHRAIP